MWSIRSVIYIVWKNKKHTNNSFTMQLHGNKCYIKADVYLRMQNLFVGVCGRTKLREKTIQGSLRRQQLYCQIQIFYNFSSSDNYIELWFVHWQSVGPVSFKHHVLVKRIFWQSFPVLLIVFWVRPLLFPSFLIIRSTHGGFVVET